MKLKKILSLFTILATFKTDLQARLSDAVKDSNQLEGQEISQPVKEVFWAVDWAQKQLKDMAETESFVKDAEAILEAHNKEIADAAIAAAIADKSVLKFEDHETLLAAAKTTAKQEAEAEFQAERAKDQSVAERRVTIEAEIGKIAADTLTREDLLAEDHEARVAKVKDRVTKLEAVGITAESRAKNFASLLACKADADGDKEFESRLELLSEAGISASSPGGSPAPRVPVIPAGKTETPSGKYGAAAGI